MESTNQSKLFNYEYKKIGEIIKTYSYADLTLVVSKDKIKYYLKDVQFNRVIDSNFPVNYEYELVL